MFSHCLKISPNNTWHDRVYAPASILAKKERYPGLRGIACYKLTLTLAGQIWRHNYVIGRSEYLISALLESTVPLVYSLQFLFKSTNHSRRYERNCEWVFFLNTVYIPTTNGCVVGLVLWLHNTTILCVVTECCGLLCRKGIARWVIGAGRIAYLTGRTRTAKSYLWLIQFKTKMR